MFPKDTQIAIVDDMSTARQIIVNYLTSMGFTTLLELANGLEAFELMKTSAEVGMPIGLVIADWNMPEMPGFELLQKVRTTPELSLTPFMLVTTEGESMQVVKAVKVGVDDYLIKPYTEEQFQKKMAALWNKASRRMGA